MLQGSKASPQSLSCNLAQLSHGAFISQERDSHSLLRAAVLSQRLWKSGNNFSLPLAQAHSVPGSLQAGQRQTQILSAQSRANSGKLRRGRSSLPLSSRSAVSYTGFSFLALSMLKMCKTKRLLSVHPFDFELDSDYSAQSRRQSLQLSPAASSPDAFQVLGDSWGEFLSFLPPSPCYHCSFSLRTSFSWCWEATVPTPAPHLSLPPIEVLCLRPSQEQDT